MKRMSTMNKQSAAAQTASTGDLDMMTFIPGPTGIGSSEHQSDWVKQREAAKEKAASPFPLRPSHTIVQSSLAGQDRGESIDEEAFNASLDVLLKEASSDPYAASLTSNSPDDKCTDLDVGVDMGIGLIDPPTKTAGADEPGERISGSQNDKRQSLPAIVVGRPISMVAASRLTSSTGGSSSEGAMKASGDMASSSATSSLFGTATVAAKKQELRKSLKQCTALQYHHHRASRAHQQQDRPPKLAQTQQTPIPARMFEQNHFSSKGMIQLPPMFSSHPVSVAPRMTSMPHEVHLQDQTQKKKDQEVTSCVTGARLSTGGQRRMVGDSVWEVAQHQQLQFQKYPVALPQQQISLTGLGGTTAGLMAPLLPFQQLQQKQQTNKDFSQMYQVPFGPFGQRNPYQQNTRATASLGFPAEVVSTQAPTPLSSVNAVDAPFAAAGILNPVVPAASTLPEPFPPSSTSAQIPINSLFENNQKRSSLAVSEDQGDKKKRRSERNLREQERSHRITERISELRNVLAEAGQPYKPDKYSTLVSVVTYIQELKERSSLLDEEHQKLLDTIADADRLVKSCVDVGRLSEPRHDGGTTTVQTHSRVVGKNPLSRCDTSSTSSDSNSDDELLVSLQGIDFKSVFSNCGAALAIASVDGRFMDCNEEFLRVTEYSRKELLGEPRRCSSHQDQGSPSDGIVTISTNTSSNSLCLDTVADAATVCSTKKTVVLSPSSSTHLAHAPFHRHRSGAGCSVGRPEGSSTLSGSDNHSSGGSGNSRPPSEIHKEILSLFNLLGREDMETVYKAMSHMLRSSSIPHATSPTSGETGDIKTDGGGTSSSSIIRHSSSSDSPTRPTEEESSGNEVSAEGERIHRSTVDNWSGNVKHSRRKDRMLHLNISLVRTSDGRPKFFNCALSDAE